MQNNKVIRWGMVGCGAVTRLKSAPAYQQTEGFELAAVYGRTTSKVRAYADEFGVPEVYLDAEQMMANDDIDAIYIATPPDSHMHYALMAAKFGKPCCIEKPLAPSLKECEQIVAAFEQANLPLFVAYYRRSLPRFNQVKQLLDTGAIGDVRHISWHLSKAANEVDLKGLSNWRTDKTVARGGYFDDLASHGLDLFGFLLGDYQQVSSVCTNQQGLYSAYDAISACWLHNNGVTGSGSWNFGCEGRFDDVVIYGQKGHIAFSVFDERAISVSCQGQGQEVKNFEIANPKHIQQFHVANMFESLVKGKAHPSTGKTALHSAWVMEQILMSSCQNKQKD